MWRRNRRGAGSMSSYTGFCQEVNGLGTIWIQSFDAKDREDAAEVAQKLCAEAWDCGEDDVHVLGIARGNVDIIYWEDINAN